MFPGKEKKYQNIALCKNNTLPNFQIVSFLGSQDISEFFLS